MIKQKNILILQNGKVYKYVIIIKAINNNKGKCACVVCATFFIIHDFNEEYKKIPTLMICLEYLLFFSRMYSRHIFIHSRLYSRMFIRANFQLENKAVVKVLSSTIQKYILRVDLLSRKFLFRFS